MTTYVVGHTNPDTDSVVSAIVYAKIEGGIPAVAGELNKETELVLAKFGFDVPTKIPGEEKKVILVDHNSPEEMALEVEKEEVVGIIDHHRLYDSTFGASVEMNMKPYGSTATIITLLAYDHHYTLNPAEASLLLAGIISDTLNFASPGTTKEDKDAAEKLNQIAGIDMDGLAKEMFAAKSDISGLRTDELVEKDYKMYEMNGYKVGIGVWETVNPVRILDRKAEIIKYLAEKKVQDSLSHIFFTIVNIRDDRSEMYILSGEEQQVAEAIWGGETKEQILELSGVISRDKQIVPPLEAYFSR